MLYSLLISTRPRQWVKNIFVFPAILFSQHLFEIDYLLRSVWAALCFCFLSGAVYLLNDVLDRDRDRVHPLKSKRPIAAGAVSLGAAVATSALLSAGSIWMSFRLNEEFGWVSLTYAMLNVA